MYYSTEKEGYVRDVLGKNGLTRRKEIIPASNIEGEVCVLEVWSELREGMENQRARGRERRVEVWWDLTVYERVKSGRDVMM